ncbi:MAG: hypothetical protein QGI18_00240 [Candidatus Marinimicrobia bacterium]|nr:hypothetical protein [Candidatus Neomarinimicrobiota bacterium]
MYLPISAGGHFGCDFGGHVGISGVQNMLKLFVVLYFVDNNLLESTKRP